jgi:hypothetical protein
VPPPEEEPELDPDDEPEEDPDDEPEEEPELEPDDEPEEEPEPELLLPLELVGFATTPVAELKLVPSVE